MSDQHAELDRVSTVDGLGCSGRTLAGYLDWAERRPAAEPEPPGLEAG
jgi:hypothetical protein